MPIRILIADDHSLVAEGLKALLATRAEFDVIGHESDGREAVKSALALRPNVVLMDVMMPILNGIEATREIRARLPETRVIMISMHANPEYVYRAIEAGASGYLVKRAVARELFDAVSLVHSGMRFFSAQIAEDVIDRYLVKRETLNPLDMLSARERQVLQMLAESESTASIAKALNLSVKTVETYRARLYEKLGLRDLPAVVRFAIKNGLIAVD